MSPSLLRLLVLAAGIVSAGLGGVALALGHGLGLQPLAFGLIVCVGVLFERVRYKRLETAAPSGDFRPTAERFIDPASNAPVTVYVHPRTGERKYVRD